MPDPLENKIADLETERTDQQEFISMIVHQLRTPLAGIKWALDALLKEEDATSCREQRALIEGGYRSNERMIKLIDELSRANKSQTWRFEYNPQECDVNSLLSQAIARFLPESHSRGIPLTLTPCLDQHPAVYADPDKVLIVFEHMLDNALKYAPADTSVDIGISHNDTHIIVVFHNAGTTVHPEEISSIFDKYTRGNGAETSKKPGTGMGLFTAKRIVEDQGGSIIFESSEDMGTTLTVSLPLEKEE